MTIESTIQRLTNDGEVVVQFLVDTVQGNIYNATVGHRLKSAEWLTAFGELVPEDSLPQSATVRPRPKHKPKKDKPGELDKKPLVTEKQILHFDIARLIKDETRDGETIIEFLIRVVAKIERPGENFTPAARIRAARELLIRGYGSCIPGINRIQSGKTEELDSYISKSIREYTGYGADPVRFLIDVMENKTPELDSKGAVDYNNKIIPQRKENIAFEGFKALQRVWAACELFRRGYDIRTDHITYADIQAYWNSQTPAVPHDANVDSAGSPDIDLLGISPEAVEAEVAKMIASDAAKAAAASEQNAAANPTDGNANAHSATEKPSNNSDNPDSAQDNQVSAEKPDANAPTGNANSTTTTRAARRREQRAAKKRSNPIDTANKAADASNQANEAPNPTDVDAPATDDNPDAPADVDTKPAIPPQSNPRPRLTRAERRRLKRKNRKRPPKTRSP